MNTQEARMQEQMEQFLDALGLCASNKALAEAYLLAEERNDSLLAQAQPEDLYPAARALDSHKAYYMKTVREAPDQEMLTRFSKLFWAMGKSAAVHPLTVGDASWEKTLVPFWASLLGKPAAAALLAEGLVRQHWLDLRAREWLYAWLYELADTEPSVLEQAQALNGVPNDDMPVMLAGILLGRSAPLRSGLLQKLIGGNALAARQADRIARSNRESLEEVAPDLTTGDRQALAAWLERGDPFAPLPALSVTLPDGSDPRAVLDTPPCRIDDYEIRLLGAASFQGQWQDPRLRCAVRMYLTLDAGTFLNALFRNVPPDCILQQTDTLLQDLPGGPVTLLLVLATLVSSQAKQYSLIAERCAAGARQALQLASENEYTRLLALLPDRLTPQDDREAIATMLEKSALTGKQELRRFLLEDGCDLRDAAARLAPVSAGSYCYSHNPLRALKQRFSTSGWDDFCCRCVTALGLAFHDRGLNELLPKGQDPASLARALLDRGLPAAQLLDVFSAFHEAIYFEQDKVRIRDAAYKVLARPEYRGDLCAAASQNDVFGRCAALSALDDLAALPGEEGAAARAGILACAGDSSKQVQELLVNILALHPDWALDVAALLQSKKAAERLLAIQVAARWGDTLRGALETALATEKSAKVAEAIRAVLGQAASPSATPAGQPTPDQLAERTLKGGKRRKLQWVLEPPLPAVRQTDGSPVSEDRRDALLAAYCEMGRIGRSETAAAIAQGLDTDDLAALAAEVYERWLAAGAQSKTKWVLAFAAAFGGPSMTPRLRQAIHDWPQHSRGAIACEAVTALALSPDPAALLEVDAIARKFKFRQVKTAAAAALENAAKELGITAEELADRIVPDLGFAADGTRVFDYGPRRFTVRLTPMLEMSITNDAGKPVKNLPAPGKTDDPEKAAAAYEAFKAVKKQMRTTVSAQKARLEAALAALRCWDADAWQALFVNNPLMRQFAISLIWGVYKDGKLTDTFRYMEDGSFNTADEEEYTLPSAARIGLVHPVELDAAARDAWKQQLEDYEITPAIPQLDRPVYPLKPGRETQTRLEDFGGKKLNGLSLSGKLLGMGWYRGSVQDAGCYYTFYREDPTLGLGVELNFSGAYIGDENDTVTVQDAVFYRFGTVRRGSYCYDVPQEENILPLGQVPERYYSEIVYQLTRATASSTETDPDWKSRKN